MHVWVKGQTRVWVLTVHRLVFQSSWPVSWGFSCLHPHPVVGTLGLQMYPITSGFDVGSGDFNSSPHAVAASFFIELPS